MNSKFHFELKFHTQVMLKYPKNSTKSPIPGALTLGYLKVVAFYSPAPAKSNCPPKPHQNCPNLLNSPQNGDSAHPPSASTQELPSTPKRGWNSVGSRVRLEKTSQVTESNQQPWPPPTHVPKCHLHVGFEPFQGWGLQHFTIQEFPAKGVSTPPKIPVGLEIST